VRYCNSRSAIPRITLSLQSVDVGYPFHRYHACPLEDPEHRRTERSRIGLPLRSCMYGGRHMGPPRSTASRAWGSVAFPTRHSFLVGAGLALPAPARRARLACLGHGLPPSGRNLLLLFTIHTSIFVGLFYLRRITSSLPQRSSWPVILCNSPCSTPLPASVEFLRRASGLCPW
jgi:hypothetical protein